MAETTATLESIQEAVSRLGKPRIKYVLRLVQFLGGLLVEGGIAAQAMRKADVRGSDAEAAVLGAILTSLSEQQLCELGQILLQDETLRIREEDLDLVWLTEALAVWAETVNLTQIIKNAQRVAAAIKL